jgi:hypothetical protein
MLDRPIKASRFRTKHPATRKKERVSMFFPRGVESGSPAHWHRATPGMHCEIAVAAIRKRLGRATASLLLTPGLWRSDPCVYWERKP